jgi:hypothetical protein
MISFFMTTTSISMNNSSLFLCIFLDLELLQMYKDNWYRINIIKMCY